MKPSILEVLGTLPSGQVGPALDLTELGAYLKATCNTSLDRDRNVRHGRRDEFYRDGGVPYMRQVIDSVFQDQLVRELRKKWVEHARFSNTIKRVINELSTVYVEPATRLVSNATNATYQSLLAAVSMDEVMLQMSRLLNLHRALLVGFRVRAMPDGEREPIIDIVTPAAFRVVLHPNDATLPIGWIVRSGYKPARNMIDVPEWTLWTDVESVQLKEDMTIVPNSYRRHDLGINPWTPVTLGPPTPGWWPGDEGEDLAAAHVAIWILSIFHLKEAKSATKQTVLTGDGTMMARSQAADSEVPIETADGMSVSTVDMAMDLQMFKMSADHVLEHVAQNYGMSAALISHQGVQSAEARELMREPLRELRALQHLPLRRFEKRFAQVMAHVCSVDLQAYAFDASGWRIEFGEPKTRGSATDEFNLFLARRQAGVDNTVEYIKRQRPDMTDDEAQEMVLDNIAVETWRVANMRTLQAMSGSMGEATPELHPGEHPIVDPSQPTAQVAPQAGQSTAGQVANSSLAQVQPVPSSVQGDPP